MFEVISNRLNIKHFLKKYSIEKPKNTRRGVARADSKGNYLSYKVSEDGKVDVSIKGMSLKSSGDADIIKRDLNNHIKKLNELTREIKQFLTTLELSKV